MKKHIYITLLVLTFFSCSKDCNESKGKIVQQEVEVSFFSKIIVHSGVELIVKDDVMQRVVVETGEHKLDNVSVLVEDDILHLEADSFCVTTINLDPVKVYVTSANITSIRNASEYTISSDGVLTYPEIKLLVENHESDYLTIGNFDLKVNNNSIQVTSNNLANVCITGQTNNLNLGYYSGIGRFEGENLVAQHVYIHHRGENTLTINPQLTLTGDILSVGNVISYNHPETVDVEEHYEGRLIFE